MEEEHDVETETSSESSLELDPREEKWIKHYSSSHRILLVGDGDFSFSLCLANAFGTGTNMVATSLDNEGTHLCYSRFHQYVIHHDHHNGENKRKRNTPLYMENSLKSKGKNHRIII